MFRKRLPSVNPTGVGCNKLPHAINGSFPSKDPLLTADRRPKIFLFALTRAARSDQRTYDSTRLIGLARLVAPWQAETMEHGIKHSCGHEQTHMLYGIFAADIDRQVARLARQKCKPCYLAGKKVAEEARAAADVPIIAELVFASLQGSAKQIAWAEGIRTKRISALQRRGHGGVNLLAAVVEAKWWIDYRDVPDDQLLSLCPVAPKPDCGVDGRAGQAISNSGSGAMSRTAAAAG